jgi:hypothetical protein
MENRTTTLNVTPKRRSKSGKYFRNFMIVLLLVLAGFFYWKFFFTYSSGNRYGLLQKFSHKGNLFKTYEGELILSSVRGNNNVPLASEKFFFSVTNKRVADQLMNVQGKFLTVHYKEKNGSLSFRGDSPYIVDSIRVEQP